MSKKYDLKSNWKYRIDKLGMRLRLLRSQDWTPIKKSFIISTGRTGTHFLSEFLNQFSSVFSIHEPHPTFLRLAINYACGEVTDLKAVKKVERCRRALCREIKREDANIYFEASNRLFSLVPILRKVFSDCSIVHIVRDGRDYVRSGMSRNWYKEEDDGSRLRAIYFEDDKYYDKWEDMSRFEKICWEWQKKDQFIWQEIKDSDDAITVKFEDIFKNDKCKGIYEIADYIDLPREETDQIIEQMMNRKVNSTKEYAIPKWPAWSQERQEKFDAIAGQHMAKYYDYSWE
ncbi:sulfotransferase domain-containing protein [Halanaerobaculum tunisiense]